LPSTVILICGITLVMLYPLSSKACTSVSALAIAVTLAMKSELTSTPPLPNPNPHRPRPRNSPIINIPSGGPVKFSSVWGVVVVLSVFVVVAVTVAVSSLFASEICDALSACTVRNIPLMSAAPDMISSSVKPILFLSMAVHLRLFCLKSPCLIAY
jgi:hypothetical protein